MSETTGITPPDEITTTDITAKKLDLHDENGKFKEGHVGIGGRPKGSISIKDEVRKHLEAHPEEVEEIVKHFVKTNRELMWQMLEGRPQQDVTSDGKALPTPVYVPRDDSLKEDKPIEETNTGDTGGNIS